MTGKLALVTGASSGIGDAFCRDLVRRGYSLVIVARRAEKLEALSAALAPADIEILPADLATDTGIHIVSERLGIGDIHLLVNNAGVGYRGVVAAQPDESISQLVRLNLEAPMRLTRAILPAMIQRREGTIINVASMGAFQPVPYLNVYAATKAGLLSFTEALADEVAASGVTVQALCPGNIPTGFQNVAGTAGSRLDRMPSMSAATVASRSLDTALGKGATVQVPGGMDKISVFAQRFLPRFVARRIAGSLLKAD